MGSLRAHRRITAWLAAVAMLLAALAPAVAHALAAHSAPAWLEVCSAQGSRGMLGGKAADSQAPSDDRAFEHCPFCATHAPAAGVPPAPPQAAPAAGADDFLSPALPAAPRPAPPRTLAQPRAPPQQP